MTAVLLDALGTLVVLEPPAPRLAALLGQAGLEVSEKRAAAGFGAEIAYYIEHHAEGADAAGVEDLRDRCATVLRDALGLEAAHQATVRRAMLGALRFEAYPETLPVLRELRAAGHVLVVVSNWDRSLPEWVGHTGLLDAVDGVVTSAEAGAPKPDGRIFARALALAGAVPGEAVHVGDSPEADVAGARAAGLRAVLVQREGEPPPGVRSIATLRELPALL